MACRYCDLQRIYCNHIYYPTTPPSVEINKTYDPSNLPKRIYKDYKERIEQILTILSSRKHDELAIDLGK